MSRNMSEISSEEENARDVTAAAKKMSADQRNPLLLRHTFQVIALFAGVRVTIGVMTTVSRWHWTVIMSSPIDCRNWLDQLLKSSEIRIPRSLRLICMNKAYCLSDSSSLMINCSSSSLSDSPSVSSSLAQLSQQLSLSLNMCAVIGLVFDPRESHVDLFERIESELRSSEEMMKGKRAADASLLLSSLSSSSSSLLLNSSVSRDVRKVLEAIDAVAKRECNLGMIDLRRYTAARRSLEFDCNKITRKMSRCETHLSSYASFLEKWDSDDRQSLGMSRLRSLEQTKDDVEETQWKLNKYAEDRKRVACELGYAKVELETQEKKVRALQRIVDRISHAKSSSFLI